MGSLIPLMQTSAPAIRILTPHARVCFVTLVNHVTIDRMMNRTHPKPILPALSLTTAFILAATSGVQAAVTIIISESGSNVVATGSGSINLAALSSSSTPFGGPGLRGNSSLLRIGPSSSSFFRIYGGANFVSSLGSGTTVFNPNSGSGNVIGASGALIFVPDGYFSGSPLSATSTWNSATISSLGLTPGTYTWSWGSGGTADSLTVQIEGVPEPSSLLVMSGGAMMLALRRGRRNGN